MQQLDDHIIDILRNDHCVALAYRTPAGGVVLTPVTTVGMFDAEAGTVGMTSSFGNWKKMLRMRGDNRVALVYHTRQHSGTSHPQMVVVQGRAAFPDRADGSWATAELQRRTPDFMPTAPRGRLLKWVTREYYDHRVVVSIAIEHVIIDNTGLPGVVPSQQPPAKGTAARVRAKKYRARWTKCTHFLVGYTDANGFPMAHIIQPSFDNDDIVFKDTALPMGVRRAGLLAHWFEHRLVGQGSVVMTGWLEVDATGSARYSPHTTSGYAMPPKENVFHLAGGLAAKAGYRSALRKGYIRDGVWVGTGD